MTGIHLRNIGKTYRLADGTTKTVLARVDLEIDPGEFVCLLGPSGCGKSTLLNIISGLDGDHEGTVTFTDTHAGSGTRPQTGYIFQEARLLPWVSVQDNLRFVLDHARGSAEADRRIAGWLERVGLSGYGNYFPGQLSIGMQQRVSVARALILDPQLLLMDEPFSSLDELTALRMRTELLELWGQSGATVVFVTHNPMEAVFLADRVMIMTPSPGRIAEEIRIGETLPRPRNFEDQQLWELSREAVRRLMGDKRVEARSPQPR